MENPELSIIIPVYNVLSYLDRCLQSILNQSFSDFELVIVDDGSTDGSSALLDKYATQDERITVVHQSNAGVSVARNTALKLSKGHYITFVDPDDFISENTYKCNMEYLQANINVDILQYPYCHYIDDNHEIKKIRPESKLLVGKQSIFAAWWSGSPLEYVIWNKIYRCDIWDNVTFNAGHISEDTGLVANFCQRANRVYISNQGLYYYQRERHESYTYKYSFDKHIDLFNAHFAIYQLFKLYPSMTTEKVLSYTRLFRRLIQAKQEFPLADVSLQQKSVAKIKPSCYEIFKSVGTKKIWLYSANLLGVRLFMFLFLKYLKK